MSKDGIQDEDRRSFLQRVGKTATMVPAAALLLAAAERQAMAKPYAKPGNGYGNGYGFGGK